MSEGKEMGNSTLRFVSAFVLGVALLVFPDLGRTVTASAASAAMQETSSGGGGTQGEVLKHPDSERKRTDSERRLELSRDSEHERRQRAVHLGDLRAGGLSKANAKSEQRHAQSDASFEEEQG